MTTVLSRSDPRLVECRIRLAELCPGFLALGRQDLNLLLRAGESGLCSGNARVGFLGIGGSGFKALARRPSIAGELGVARVIERGADPLGFGAVERSAGLIDRIALQDQTLVDGGNRCLRRGDCRLALGNGGGSTSAS